MNSLTPEVLEEIQSVLQRLKDAQANPQPCEPPYANLALVDAWHSLLRQHGESLLAVAARAAAPAEGLTAEEADAEYDAAEPIPISDSEIERLVGVATNPVAEIDRLTAAMADAEGERDRLKGLLMEFGRLNAQYAAQPRGIEQVAERPALWERRQAAQQAIYDECKRLAQEDK